MAWTTTAVPVVFSRRDLFPVTNNAEWTPEAIGQQLGSQSLKIRLGSRRHMPGTVQWENKCTFVESNAQDFVNWGLRDNSCIPTKMKKATVDQFSPVDYWGYFSYKDMFEVFTEDYLAKVQWGCFGLKMDGLDSTFWMGTPGAYTPCHFDTYGFNLVAQLYGRKRWVLFPPSDIQFLRPTRVPYEESSVFSKVDILSVPDCLEGSHPYVVELSAGEVLYVPSRWWHFVQCLEFSVSINTWVPISSDRTAHLNEAVVQCLVQSLLINNAESFNDADEAGDQINISFEALDNVLQATHVHTNQRNVVLDSTDDEESKFRRDFEHLGHSVTTTNLSELQALLRKENPLSFTTDSEPLIAKPSSNASSSRLRFFECISQPDIVDLVVQKLRNSVVQ